MNEKDIDKLFSEAFKDVESSPPTDLWEKIEMQLPVEKKEVPILKRYRFAIASVAAAALIIMGVALVLYTSKHTKTNLLANKEPRSIPQQSKPAPIDNSIPVETTSAEKDASAAAQKAKPVVLMAVTTKKTSVISKPKVVQPAEHTNMKHIEKQEIKQGLDKENNYVHVPNEIANEDKLAEIPVRQVVEIDPIKPLIEPEEDLESMYATQTPVVHKTVVTTLLNVISENIEVSAKKDIRFRADDEGSIRVDFINTIVKNRTKKRK